VFEMTVFRRIRGVTGRDRHRNVDIRKELGVSRDVVNEVRHRRLSYFGHVVRMLLSRVPSISLYGRVEGTKPCGRPRKKWLDGLRENIKITRITLREYMMRDRRLWSCTVYRLLERVGQFAVSSSPTYLVTVSYSLLRQ